MKDRGNPPSERFVKRHVWASTRHRHGDCWKISRTGIQSTFARSLLVSRKNLLEGKFNIGALHCPRWDHRCYITFVSVNFFHGETSSRWILFEGIIQPRYIYEILLRELVTYARYTTLCVALFVSNTTKILKRRTRGWDINSRIQASVCVAGLRAWRDQSIIIERYRGFRRICRGMDNKVQTDFCKLKETGYSELVEIFLKSYFNFFFFFFWFSKIAVNSLESLNF